MISYPCHIASTPLHIDTQTCFCHCKREALAGPVKAPVLSESHTAQMPHAAKATL